MIHNDTSVQMTQKQNLSFDRQKNMPMLINDETSNYQELVKKDDKEEEKVLEIKRIECEQRLIVDRMIQLELQKQRLRNLLDVLHSLDSDDDDDDDDDSIDDD
jgi:hypothetical protein